MNLKWIFGIGLLATIIGFTACKRDDDEPFVNRDFSRLYIAFSDYNPNDQGTQPVNIGVMLRSDSSNFENTTSNFMYFESATRGGNAITFNPAAQRVFMSTINREPRDTVLQIFPVGPEGNLTNSGKIQNRHLKNVTGLVYYPSVDNLFALDNANSTIAVYNRPKGRDRYMKVSQRFIITDALKPWAIAIASNIVYVTRTGANGGIDIYDDVVSRKVDTLYNDVKASRRLTISGSQNIQGMSLDTVNNVLAVTDYTGSGTTAQGKILIFENFSELAKQEGTISPTRVIAGGQTGLIRPTDVELDFKKDSKYLFVADPGAKAVYRFLKTATGDAKPDAKFVYGDSTPSGLSLDSR